MSKGKTVIFWGLIVMVAYLYAYEFVFAFRWGPSPAAIEHGGYELRNPQLGWNTALNRLYRYLWNLSFPTVALSQRFFPEPYYSTLIYIPFINAFQWFGYGCLFGLWRYKRNAKAGAVVQV